MSLCLLALNTTFIEMRGMRASNFSNLCVKGLVLALGVLAVAGCRPRAARNARQTTPQNTSAQGQSAPSAKSVLSHADSALARVAALGREDEPVPSAAPDMTPRTPWGSPYIPQPDLTDYATFQAALGAYNGKRYDDAIALFSQVVNSGRPPEMLPNAYYWIGESLYAEGRYAESMPYFEYVTRVGPTYKREMSTYKLSRANLHLGNKTGANLWYERLRNEYPRSGYITTLKKLGAR